jgi:tRNA pseudouridine38-40 synthase
MKYLINLSYDGSKFYGFQRQKDKCTVAFEIEKALSKIFNCNICITGASRTDRGVHAYNQYAHFESEKEMNIDKLKHSMNSLLNNSIYVKDIRKVSNEFNARYDVKSKEYLYKINIGEYLPMEKEYVLQYNKNINIALLRKSVKIISGTHNFKSFTSDNESTNYVRTIKYIKIKKYKNYVYIYISATGFLRYMVRNIVGLLLEINEGKKQINDINRIFESEDRKENGVTAPSVGLYLNKIYY